MTTLALELSYSTFSLVNGREDAFEILAVFTGLRTEEFSVPYLSRKVTEFITPAGSGFINNTVFTAISDDS